MKARIEKKLSKRLTEIAPLLCAGWWVDEEISARAHRQGTSVSHIRSVGGGQDYWGECCDGYVAWYWWLTQWAWHGDFTAYQQGHEHEHCPNTKGFRPTTQNLLRLAAEANDREAAALAERKRRRAGGA